MNLNQLTGHYTHPAQTEPAYDPPHNAPCPLCWQRLTPDDIRTVNLMAAQDATLSLFFRVHRSCADNDPAALEEVEQAVVASQFELAGDADG